MIPSENYASKAVREAVGSVFMNKYAEGYPNARYYEGNEFTDELENLCRDMCVKVMTANDSVEVQKDWHANVQVLSGSLANLAVYNTILNPGDKILSMYLPDGGHLTHGWSYEPKTKSKSSNQQISKIEQMVYRGGSRKVSFTSKMLNPVQYKTDPETYLFDYDFIEKLALEEKPKLIITGGTAYSRNIDYKRMREICDKVGSIYHADVAHEAGLIAGGAVPSPFEYADFVTFTTHKTLRGPRGAVAMARKKYADQLDKSVMPGIQGGPFEHNIAGICQMFFEADTPEFKEYTHQIVKNAKALAEELINHGFKLITGGTDKHLIVSEVLNTKEIGGKYLARALAHAGIVANMNTTPYEKGSPINPSGIRFGTPILTTRGMKESEMKVVAGLINEVTEGVKGFSNLEFGEFESKVMELDVVKSVRERVEQLCEKFPIER
jgi:glycine hydroxymethyltransferase